MSLHGICRGFDPLTSHHLLKGTPMTRRLVKIVDLLMITMFSANAASNYIAGNKFTAVLFGAAAALMVAVMVSRSRERFW